MKVTYTIEEAKKYGFKKLETMAKAYLKLKYRGDWKKAVIKADVVDNMIVYEVTEQEG